MTAPVRVKANALKLTVDSVEYSAELSEVALYSEEAASDVTTFATAATGGSRDFKLRISGPVSTTAGSLFRVFWTNAGDEVAFEMAPWGNSTATADQPIYSGIVRLPAAGAIELGGQASVDGTFNFSGLVLDVVGDVTVEVS